MGRGGRGAAVLCVAADGGAGLVAAGTGQGTCLVYRVPLGGAGGGARLCGGDKLAGGAVVGLGFADGGRYLAARTATG